MTTAVSIQDRTTEFRSILGQAQKRIAQSKPGPQRQAFAQHLQQQSDGANGTAGAKHPRSEFARRAAEIGRGITATTGKLQRLAQCEYLRIALLGHLELTT